MTALFTQGYRDAGFEGLVPLGVAFARESYIEGKAACVKAIREQFDKAGVAFVFKCKFKFGYTGHPSNGKMWVECIGDAYALPKGGWEAIVPHQEPTNGKEPTKLTTKKGWQLRCGLVSINEEVLS